MKWRYQKLTRILYGVLIALILVGLLAMGITVAIHTEFVTIRNIAIACSVALLFLAGAAIQETQNQIIKRRGFNQRTEAFSREAPLIKAARLLSRGHKEPVDRIVPQDFIYVKREDGSMGQVYLMDIYQALISDQQRPSVLRQQDWVLTKRMDRQYLDDIRQICLQAGVVRAKGNGALVPLHPPGYSIEQIKRQFYN